MIIRGLRKEDINEARIIHERYYKEEFNFPDFLRKFLCAFTVLNEKEKIVAIGGVRTVAESVIMTDRGFSPKERRSALLSVLDASEFVARRSNYDGLHAFVQDENWATILKEKYHFYPCAGEALVRDL